MVPQDPARQELEEREELDGASELQCVPGCRAAEQRMGGMDMSCENQEMSEDLRKWRIGYFSEYDTNYSQLNVEYGI